MIRIIMLGLMNSQNNYVRTMNDQDNFIIIYPIMIDTNCQNFN